MSGSVYFPELFTPCRPYAKEEAGKGGFTFVDTVGLAYFEHTKLFFSVLERVRTPVGFHWGSGKEFNSPKATQKNGGGKTPVGLNMSLS